MRLELMEPTPLQGPGPLMLASLVLGSKQYSAAIAFTLALFSHLVNHVNIRLQAELEEGENPVPAFQSDGTGAGSGEVVTVERLAWGVGIVGGEHRCGRGGAVKEHLPVSSFRFVPRPHLTILFPQMNQSPRNPWRRRRSRVLSLLLQHLKMARSERAGSSPASPASAAGATHPKLVMTVT